MKRFNLLFLVMLIGGYPLFGQEIFDYVKEGNLEKISRWLENQEQIKNSYVKEDLAGMQHTVNILEWAAFFDQVEVVNLFIENKARFMHYNDWISRAFAASIHNCNIALANTLLDEGAKPDITCGMCGDGTPLAIALSHDCNALFAHLRSRGLPLYTNKAGFDVIHAAAGHTDSLLLKELVEKEHLDVNQKGTASPYYPLFDAVIKGQIQNVRYLHSKGARLDVKDENGLSLLHYANQLEMFKLLEGWSTPASLGTIDESNKAFPLVMTVVMSDDRSLFDYFVVKYPNLLRARDKKGRNAMFALLETTENTEYFFTELKKKGVSFTLSDKEGNDVKYYARKMKNKAVLTL